MTKEPYKGLHPYEEKDKDNFFGRDAACKILINKILANKLTLLFAATGVGKSSLLRAAVIPELKNPQTEYLDVVYHNLWWGKSPLVDLKSEIIEQLKDKITVDIPPQKRDDFSLNDFFQFCTLFTRQPLIVILDQFEEFFQYQGNKRTIFDEFIKQIAQTIIRRDTPIAMVISMREDFALELNAFRTYLPTILFENFYRLERLTEKEAKAAIVTPVENIGFRYEDELLKTLFENLKMRELQRDPTMPVTDYRNVVEPPYLQIVCSQLWQLEKDNPAKTLRLKTYQDVGKATILLKNHVENIIGNFSSTEKQVASQIFGHLVTRRGTKTAHTVASLAKNLQEEKIETINKVLELLSGQEARILRSTPKPDGVWYELYHDMFSDGIEDWNKKYKDEQRKKRIRKRVAQITVGGIFLVTGGYAAYDFGVNYTSYHLRLSSKAGISDNIELYQGKKGSFDLFNQHRYLSETGYTRKEIEADKLFVATPVADFEHLNMEIIGRFPLNERLNAYYNVGKINKALDLADKVKKETEFRSLKNLKSLISRIKLKEDGATFWKLEQAKHSKLIIPLLLPLLKNEDSDIRSGIVSTLEKLGAEEAVEPLIILLSDSESKVRRAAVLALKRLNAKKAIKSLMSLIHDPDSEVRENTVLALHKLYGEKSVEILIPMLSDQNDKVRSAVAEILGQLKNKKAVEHLINLLDDSDSTVRGSVAEALGRLGDKKAIEHLTILLKDKSDFVQQSARKALAKLDAEKAFKQLKLWLITKNDSLFTTNSEDTIEAVNMLLTSNEATLDKFIAIFVRQYILQINTRDYRRIYWKTEKKVKAKKILNVLGKDRIETFLLKRLKSSDSSYRRQAIYDLGELNKLDMVKNDKAIEFLTEFLEDSSRPVHIAAARILAQLGSEKAIKPLITLFKDENVGIRFHALKALQLFNDSKSVNALNSEKTIEPLINLLSYENVDIRVYAIRALSSLNSSKSVEALTKQLNDKNPLIRAEAVWALYGVNNKKNVKLLIEMLNDQDIGVRRAVVAALGQLGNKKALAPLIELFKEISLIDKDFGEIIIIMKKLTDKEKKEMITNINTLAVVLGKLDSEKAVELLIKNLETLNYLRIYGSRYPVSKMAVINTLTELGNETIIENLVHFLAFSKLYRKFLSDNLTSVILALGTFGSDTTVKSLVYLLKRQDDHNEATHVLKKLESMEAINSVEDIISTEESSQLEQLKLTPQKLEEFRKKSSHFNIITREEVAEELGEVFSEEGTEILLTLLNDENMLVRRQAIKSLGQIKAHAALPKLHELLKDPQRGIRQDTVEALKEIASPTSIALLEERMLDTKERFRTRLSAIKALSNIGTEAVVPSIIKAVKQHPEMFSFLGYKALGKIRSPKALSFLHKQLNQLQKHKQKWRKLRDEIEQQENVTDEKREQLKKLTPERTYLEGELGYAIAQIDPKNAGIELLYHDIAKVRKGAWLGIGIRGKTSIIKHLYTKRKNSKKPLFIHAAYQAIDNSLIALEMKGNKTDLQTLQAWWPKIPDNEAVWDRVEFTIAQLNYRLKQSATDDEDKLVN